MNETSITRPSQTAGYGIPPDDAPSHHSSVGNVVPANRRRLGFRTMDEMFDKRWEARDTTFRDAQEYQGRSQDIAETGLPDLPPQDGYRTIPDAPR